MSSSPFSRVAGAVLVAGAICVMVAGPALAFGGYLTDYKRKYPTAVLPQDDCLVCHASSDRGTWNRYGEDLRTKTSGAMTDRLTAIENDNSDNDVGGNSNGFEAENGFQPGWCVAGSAGCNNNGFTPPTGVTLDPPASPPQNKPPVADAGGPYTATTGVMVTFDGSGSSDPDGTIASYAWNFGNGSTGSGVNAGTTYTNPGSYTVTLTVTDNGGATGSDSATVTVDVGRQPPVADAGGPYDGTAGVAITLDGSGSTDPDGSIVTYDWNFGNGESGSGAMPVVTYVTAGNYTVSLTVTDNDGLTDIATATVRIADAGGQSPPVADAGGPYSATSGAAIQFDGSGSSDPDNDIASYEWDFGDGATASGPTPTHAYAAAGSYTVSLTVTDDAGGADTDTTTAQVDDPATNSPPVADAGGPYVGEPGAPVRFDGTGSFDPEGGALAFAWDFGDGAARAGATTQDATPSHTYATAGNYLVTLRVTDAAGATSEAATATVSVQPVSDGKAAYDTYCADCHGDPWGDPVVDPNLRGVRRVAGASACVIAGAIEGTAVFPDGAPGMGGLPLSAGQIDAIAVYLNSQAPTGEQLYIANCAGCHGNDGRGGRVDEGVLGEDAEDIREAIREEADMAYLACLGASDIERMALFLGGDDGQECEDADDCEQGKGRKDKEKRGKCKRDDDCDADGRRDEDDADDDDDRMPDDYEESMGLNPFDASDASADADGDGKTNLAEFRAGTDPLDATSTPGILGGAGGIGHAALLGLALLGLGRRRRPAVQDEGDRAR